MKTINRLAALAVILLVSARAAAALPQPPTATGEAADESCPAGFDATYYAANNPDVVQYMNNNPTHFTENGTDLSSRVCLHFVRWGYSEGRLPSSMAAQQADLIQRVVDVALGCGEGWDADYYAANNPDVVAYLEANPSHFNELGSGRAKRLCAHYRKWGREEGRARGAAEAVCTGNTPPAQRCGASFDTDHYLATYPDVAATLARTRCDRRTFVDACDHYQQYGQYEGRQTSPTTTPPPSTANNNNNDNTPDGGALTPAQQAEQQRNQGNWGDMLWTGAVPRMRGALTCQATAAQRAANPSLPAPSGFSPVAPPCSDSEVAAFSRDGGKPVNCGAGYALVRVGGTDAAPQLACAASQHTVDRRILEQESQIVDFLVARGMDRGMARVFIRAYGACGVFSTVCSVNRDGSYNRFGRSYSVPPVSLNGVNDGWFPRLDWSVMSGYGMNVSGFGQGTYTPSANTAPPPPMCQGATTQATVRDADRAFGC